MRKLALVLAGLVVGVTISWQVVAAQDGGAPLATLCTRAGTDVRSPATNGTCPSGYTKVVIPAASAVFDEDTGEQLTFTMRYVIPAEAARTGSTVQLVAVAPDGTITLGTPQSAATVGSKVDTITIADPPFGAWQVGVQWAGSNTTFGGDVRAAGQIEVVASRDLQRTNLSVPPMPFEAPVGAMQMLADFAYLVPVPPTTVASSS